MNTSTKVLSLTLGVILFLGAISIPTPSYAQTNPDKQVAWHGGYGHGWGGGWGGYGGWGGGYGGWGGYYPRSYYYYPY